MNSSLIAILTDYGNTDPFVGILKGVIAQLAPAAMTTDITHEIPAGDVRHAAIVLWQAVPYFPKDTIVLAVVDPGVGTSRRPLIFQQGPQVSSRSYTFIGPDNGLFSYVISEGYQAWELRNPDYLLPDPGTTFDGRDIFAPAAAHVANGRHGSQFGPPVADPIRLDYPALKNPDPHTLVGEILHSDHFGNLLTSLGRFERVESDYINLKSWVSQANQVKFLVSKAHLALPDGTQLPLVNTFSDIPAGACATLIGSSGLLEIVANHQRAAKLLNLPGGTTITFSDS